MGAKKCWAGPVCWQKLDVPQNDVRPMIHNAAARTAAMRKKVHAEVVAASFCDAPRRSGNHDVMTLPECRVTRWDVQQHYSSSSARAEAARTAPDPPTQPPKNPPFTAARPRTCSSSMYVNWLMQTLCCCIVFGLPCFPHFFTIPRHIGDRGRLLWPLPAPRSPSRTLAPVLSRATPWAAAWGGRGTFARPRGSRGARKSRSKTGHTETGIAVKIQNETTATTEQHYLIWIWILWLGSIRKHESPLYKCTPLVFVAVLDVFTSNRSFYPTPAVHPVSVLIHPRRDANSVVIVRQKIKVAKESR